MKYFQLILKYYDNAHDLCKNVQILTNNLRDPAKKTCYQRKSVVGEENAFPLYRVAPFASFS